MADRQRIADEVAVQRIQDHPDPPQEPLVTVGAITAAGMAALGLFAAFGVDMGDARQSAILGALGVAAPFIVAFWGRRRVIAPATMQRYLAACGRTQRIRPPTGT